MAGPLDFLRNNNVGLTQLGLGLLSGRTGTEQAAMGAQGLAGAIQNNKTVAWLQKANPELAEAVKNGVITGGDAYKMMMQQRLEAQKPKNNFMAVGKNLYDTSNGSWITPPAGVTAEDEEWGLVPVWGKDKEGNTALGQFSKGGLFRRVETGDFVPTPTIQTNNLGTVIEGRNSRTGEPVYSSPIDNSGKALDTARGEAQAEAMKQLGGAREAAGQISRQIEDLKNDAGLDSVLGPWDSRTPNVFGDATRAQSKIDRIKGQVFLQGFGMLKGGGAITEVEGMKAEQAMARLNQAQSPEDFKAALDEFNQAVQDGVAKLERAAAQNGGGVLPTGGKTGTRTSSGIQWSVEP